MSRNDKINHLVAFLNAKYDSAIIDRNHHVFSSDEIDLLNPDDITAILTVLEQQPDCLTFKYEPLYKDREAVSESKDPWIIQQFNCIEPVVDPDDAQKWNALMDYCLSIIKYDVITLEKFSDGVTAVLNEDVPNATYNENAPAVELFIDGDTLKVRIMSDRKEYIVRKNLSQGSFFIPFLEYAFNNQGKQFKINDIFARSGYKNSTALKRIFTHANLYRAFFEIIGGDNGYLIANFKPTYNDLSNRSTSIDKIKTALKSYNWN